MNVEAPAGQGHGEVVEASATAEVDAEPAQDKEAAAAEVIEKNEAALATPNDGAQDN